MNQPKIFVSSTCYDLSQVRADLHDFILSLGFQPSLSEYNTFPIDPSSDTLKNCIDNVSSSDIFILIIGTRYGYVTDNGKSITNTEYLYAKQIGIPVYIFIHKPLITVFPIWKKNRSVDFTDVVESPMVFEFVELLRENNKNWCFEFEKAQDIISTLKIQLSHLFKYALELRKKYKLTEHSDFHKLLSAKALNLILLKEEGYEVLYFSEILKDELIKHESLKLDIEYEIILNCPKSIAGILELLSWLTINCESAIYLIDSLNNLFKIAFNKYWGEPGIPADLKGLYYVASSVANIFKELINWSIEIKSTSVDDDFILIRNTLSNFVQLSIDKIWSYPDLIKSSYERGQAELANGDTSEVQIGLVLEIDPALMDTFRSEMKRLSSKYKQGI